VRSTPEDSSELLGSSLTEVEVGDEVRDQRGGGGEVRKGEEQHELEGEERRRVR
jgi:hypothetical protein